MAVVRRRSRGLESGQREWRTRAVGTVRAALLLVSGSEQPRLVAIGRSAAGGVLSRGPGASAPVAGDGG